MLVLESFTQGPRKCSYLAEQSATMEYELAARLTGEEYEARMDAGWRKFGHLLFRPICSACTGCRPIRIPVATFEPNRSQRRAQKMNADLEVRYADPTIDHTRLELFHRYHDAQEEKKGWANEESTYGEYAFNFVRNPVPSFELSVWEGSKLRAVMITDLTPNTLSAVYHYHDPEVAHRSIGTFTILKTIEAARRLNKPYVYLGYYVAGSRSMAYKLNYQPCELLGEDGVWRALTLNPPLGALVR